VLALLLLIYAALVFVFQYAALSRQFFHDEVQDVVTVEGLLYFDSQGQLQLHQDYYSRPQSHLLVDRMMEVRNLNGVVLYRSPTLNGIPLGGPNRRGEGDASFDARVIRLRDGTHAFVVSHIHVLHGQILLIRLGYSLVPLRDRMLQFFLLLVVAIPLALLLAAIAGQEIAKRALRPLERMAARAEGITASNLSHRLEIKNPKDELGHIGRVFNHLLDRLEQAFLQLQRFTADAAHELRAPLASVRTIGEVTLEKSQGVEEYREALGNILEETARLNETIDSLLLLARAEAVQPGNEQLIIATELVDEVLGLLQILFEERNISVIHDDRSAGEIAIWADRALLRVAILNVVHNALKFSPDDSYLRISYTRLETTAPMLSIAFQDQGPGLANGEHERVFDRFYTGNGLRTTLKSGTGLGLSVAKLVVDRIGGQIHFDKEVRQGAKCIFTIPLAGQNSVKQKTDLFTSSLLLP